ncbi:MAG TPA: NAD-dependent malic enzyme [Thermoanaerobaculia bacterium]|nr:NAD-dependent malic enzyme [Thermoanaerobaculia bacterium]HQR67948.1 NAD-dependent malic enzyme [Thermoanaerobaculia bacterium]
MQLLQSPAWNKGTAFTMEERTRLGLHGLLPPQIETIEEQVVRAYEAYLAKRTPLGRHVQLRALQDTNEILFYRLLLAHIEEMMPIVYTPVVAEACQQFSHIYRRPRGLFIPYPLRDAIPELLRNRQTPDVDVVVVTDGERILGIGDQGVGGLGIPIGKLTLYTLIGGIPPARTLPIVLDVGTNNEERLRDPQYLGWRQKRVTGDAYFDFVDRFVRAVGQELPGALLQWEDFATPNARPLLNRYRDGLLTFNDDIQGTAAVALGALLAATRVSVPRRLRDQTIVFLGAGSAAIGVADYLRTAMQDEGLTDAEARRRFYVVDVEGLLVDARTDLTPEQRVYARPASEVAGWPRTHRGFVGLADVVASVPATVLIGLSTAVGAFTEAIVREMASKTERPVIFPLSNPTARAEAKPEDLIRWTEGRALVATGSPYPPAVLGGRAWIISQCNNVFVFPAVGLGVVASGARRVSDGMFIAAARRLADLSPALTDPAASLLPPLGDLRSVAIEVAAAVAEAAVREGLAPAASPEALREQVVARQWFPAYDEEG